MQRITTVLITNGIALILFGALWQILGHTVLNVLDWVILGVILNIGMLLLTLSVGVNVVTSLKGRMPGPFTWVIAVVMWVLLTNVARSVVDAVID